MVPGWLGSEQCNGFTVEYLPTYRRCDQDRQWLVFLFSYQGGRRSGTLQGKELKEFSRCFVVSFYIGRLTPGIRQLAAPLEGTLVQKLAQSFGLQGG